MCQSEQTHDDTDEDDNDQDDTDDDDDNEVKLKSKYEGDTADGKHWGASRLLPRCQRWDSEERHRTYEGSHILALHL